MNPELIVFFVLALVAVITALGMLLNKNAVYSALFLILNFGTVAVFYLVLGAPFIAMTQITVYAGAIMVLFLFVIMLLGAEQLQLPHRFDWQRPLAVLFAIVLLAEIGVVVFFGDQIFPEVQPAAKAFGEPASVAELLFQEYLLPFEITGILLLAAIVGAIVITKRDKPETGPAEE